MTNLRLPALTLTVLGKRHAPLEVSDHLEYYRSSLFKVTKVYHDSQEDLPLTALYKYDQNGFIQHLEEEKRQVSTPGGNFSFKKAVLTFVQSHIQAKNLSTLFEQRLSHKDQEIKQLECEKTVWDRQLQELRGEVAETTATRDTLSLEVEGLKEVAQGHLNTINAGTTEMQRIQAEAQSAATAAANELVSEKQRLQGELDNSRANAIEIGESYQALSEEVQALHEEKNNAAAANDELLKLSKELEKERAAHQATREEVTKLHSHRPDVEMADGGEGGSAITDQLGEMANSDGAADMAMSDASQLREQVQRAEEVRTRLQYENDVAEEMRQAAEDRSAAWLNKVEQLNKDNKELKSKNTELGRSIDAEARKHEQYKAETKQEVDDLKQEIHSLRNRSNASTRLSFMPASTVQPAKDVPLPKKPAVSMDPDILESINKMVKRREAIREFLAMKERQERQLRQTASKKSTTNKLGDELRTVGGDFRVRKTRKPRQKVTHSDTSDNVKLPASKPLEVSCPNVDRYRKYFKKNLERYETERQDFKLYSKSEHIPVREVSDKERIELEELYLAPSYDDIWERGWVGKMLFSKNAETITYYSDHDDRSQMIEATVNIREFFEGEFQRILPAFIPYDLDDAQMKLCPPMLKDHAMVCFLAQFPGVHKEAAQRFLSDDEFRAFNDRLAHEQLTCTGSTEQRSMPELWDTAVNNLAGLPEFQQACLKWIGREAGVKGTCWPQPRCDAMPKYGTRLNTRNIYGTPVTRSTADEMTDLVSKMAAKPTSEDNSNDGAEDRPANGW